MYGLNVLYWFQSKESRLWFLSQNVDGCGERQRFGRRKPTRNLELTLASRASLVALDVARDMTRFGMQNTKSSRLYLLYNNGS